jgi:peptidoglycan hydrolase CwlO-like protein
VRRTIGWILGCCLIMASLGSGPRAAQDEGRTQADLATLQSQEQTTLAELFALNREREAIEAELKHLDQEQAATQAQAADLQVQIAETEATLAELKHRLANRLRILQERGQLNPFAILLGAETLSDFLDRLESITLLMAHDRKLMAQVSETQQALAHQKEALEAAETRLAALVDRARAAAAKLASEIAKRESILTGLRAERGRIEAELAKLEAAWAEVPGLLATLADAIRTSAAKADGFEPDQVDFSLFPPGATAVVSDRSLNKLVASGLSFAFQPGEASLQGRLAGAEFMLQGGFSIVAGKAIRFTPAAMRLNGVAIPVKVVEEAVGQKPIEIDLERWITPFHLLDLELSDGRLTVRSGL